MLKQKRIIILLITLGVLGGGFWLWLTLNGGWTAIALQPKFVFEPHKASSAPNYRQPSAWAAYPKKDSFANERPSGEGAASPERREAVDVFFVHPTSLLSNEAWIDDITREDPVLNLGILRAQAGAFNQCCQIYAPRYRQATLWAFIGDEPSTYASLEFAYSDVLRAFKQFLRVSGNRPFILAAHSQGSLHALRLLEEVIAPRKRISTRMVAAYLVGYTIPTDIGAKDIKPCATPRATGCYINWNSVVDDYEGDFWRYTGRLWLDGRWQTMKDKKLTCVNPLSWRLDGGLVSKSFHRGGLIVENMITKQLPALTPELVSARCSSDGLLYISKPNAEFESSMINNGDYHVYDYHLFYQPIRLNVEERIKAFFKKANRN
jgi:hypothetical protein